MEPADPHLDPAFAERPRQVERNGLRPEEVGTDPTAALRISCPVPDTGALAIPPRAYTAGKISS